MTWQRIPWLADAAAYERDVRERGFPKLIESGRVTPQDAEAELAAWRAIAELFDRGVREWDFAPFPGEEPIRPTPAPLSWSELHLYTSRCLLALEEDVKKAEANGDAAKLERLQHRRVLVDEINHQIARHKFLIDDTNTILRQRAERRREAA